MPFRAPRLHVDGNLLPGQGSILEHCYGILRRDAVPELGDALTDALRHYVERTAEFALYSGDELRGFFVDQLPGQGLLVAEAHLRQRDALETLLFTPPGGIAEPFGFLGTSGAVLQASLLERARIKELLRIESEYGLLDHLAVEVPKWLGSRGRDFALLLPFIRLVEAAGRWPTPLLSRGVLGVPGLVRRMPGTGAAGSRYAFGAGRSARDGWLLNLSRLCGLSRSLRPLEE